MTTMRRGTAAAAGMTIALAVSALAAWRRPEWLAGAAGSAALWSIMVFAIVAAGSAIARRVELVRMP